MNNVNTGFQDDHGYVAVMPGETVAEATARARGCAPMTKAALLDKAKETVADRGINYGKPEDNFARIARLWSVHMLNCYKIKVEITPTSVALMMDYMKSARLENDPNHADSWIDKAGYAACGAEISVK